MVVKDFYFMGESPAQSRQVPLDGLQDFDDLRHLVAGHFAVVEPKGIAFQTETQSLDDLDSVRGCSEPIGITIDGHPVRDAPGPPGLPFIGNYLEIYPDHLGNHQRLFDRYGPVIQTNNMGRITWTTNDPAIAHLVFQEGDFFTKKINPAHPLFGIKDDTAGVFLSDTETEAWRLSHKFLPPAFSPKAVRHYAPVMQRTMEKAFDVFDELDRNDEAWNVYHYMLKLGSQAVGKLTLGMDLGHFERVDAPIHSIVHSVAHLLSLNKKVTARGNWYASLPFGDPKRLRDLKREIDDMIGAAIAACEAGGVEDLPLQDAALIASCITDYAIRAVDVQGKKLPEQYLRSSMLVATAAGFTTTSSLLSWLIYGLVTYPGTQDRLLQELIDAGMSPDTNTTFTADNTSAAALPYLDAYVKETQRLHNPSFQPGRTAKTDLVLPGGYRLPRDAVVIPALHHIHTNPSLWDNPARFDPDRWLRRDAATGKPLPPFSQKGSYIPFAAGPRGCIGFNFALQEVKVFLPMLVLRYEFVREPGEPVEYDPMFQLVRPVNFYVRARRRESWPAKSGEGGKRDSGVVTAAAV